MQPSHQTIQILPEPQNFTYFCFRLSDMACPDCSRNFWAIFCVGRNLLSFSFFYTFTLLLTEPLQFCHRISFNFQPLRIEDSNTLPGFRNSPTVFWEIWNFIWVYHPSAILFTRSAITVKISDPAFSKDFLVKTERDNKWLWNLIFRLQRNPRHPSSYFGYPSRIFIAVPFRSETIGRALKQTSYPACKCNFLYITLSYYLERTNLCPTEFQKCYWNWSIIILEYTVTYLNWISKLHHLMQPNPEEKDAAFLTTLLPKP